MKNYIKLLSGVVIIVVAVLMPRCKKNTPSTPPDDDSARLEPGARYIIRTRFICPDGGGFILASSSNFEVLRWEWTNQENVQWQKGAEEYTWTVQEFKARANGGNPNATVHMGYGFYQTTPGGSYMMLGTGRPGDPGEDLLDHGDGPTERLQLIGMSQLPDGLIAPVSQEYAAAHPEYFEEPSTIFDLRMPTDSTWRAYNSGIKYTFNGRNWKEWLMSVTAKPTGSNCDEYRSEPVMRKEITGVGCTFLPDPNRPGYIPDVCYITQLIFEKVN